MRVLVLGATGRVGGAAVSLAAARGHQVLAFVRDPARLQQQNGVAVCRGDLRRPATLDAVLAAGVDAVVNAVRVDPLKPSTFVTDAARVVVGAMTRAGVTRYVGITGTACMRKTLTGALSISILRLTPVRHAIRDHEGAFGIVSTSGLDWTLAGCPWIKDGAAGGRYSEHDVFPGGAKTITPGDVAAFLIKVIDRPEYTKCVVGLWND